MKKKKETNIIKDLIIGPSLGYIDVYPKRKMWQKIADKLNGEFKIKHNSGYELEMHNISIPYNNWNIEISISDIRPLKFITKFETDIDFELTVSWEDFIEKVIKIWKPEIELNSKEFDKHYLINSNKPEITKKLLTNNVQETLLKYNVCSISYQTDIDEGKSEMIIVIQRKAGNAEMIYELVEMNKNLIKSLKELRIIHNIK